VSETQTPGSTLRAVTDVTTFLDEEARIGLSDRFETIDAILENAIAAALGGQEVLELGFVRGGGGSIRLNTLDDTQREWLSQHFPKSAHEGKGSWYLPDAVTVSNGPFLLVRTLLSQPRFAATVVAGEPGEAASSSGEAVFIWAALAPLFDSLLIPLTLRSRQAGTKNADEARKLQSAFTPLADALGLAGQEALEVFWSPVGWGSATTEVHTERRRRLGEALQRQATAGLGRRYRAYRIQTLIQRYYSKAKKEPPTKAQVLTKADEKTLTALFGGDWLAFLDYIGEQPSVSEEMITSLPEPKLFVSARPQTDSTAATAGVPAEEIERILGAVFGSTQSVSPVKEREAALRRLWLALDDFYARQESRMLSPNLYVLAEDWGDEEEDEEEPEAELSWETRNFLTDLRDLTLASVELQGGATTVRLPAEVVHEVERLWTRESLERFPNAMVTCLRPWKHVEAALGPAFAFWHGIVETLWYFFEERYEDRAVSGLRTRFRDQLEQLKALGFPVDDALFSELSDVERTLPPAQDVVDFEDSGPSRHGIVMTVFGTSGQRRKGFEALRDVVIKHRRAWTELCLDSYLERRWQDDLRAAAESINRHHVMKGKAPTARQLAGYASSTANCWCGGDLGALVAAIGEKDTIDETNFELVPTDRRLFVAKVFALLGGQFTPKIDYANDDDDETQERKHALADRERGAAVLATRSLRFLQLEEALGAAPTTKQFGGADFARYAERAWDKAPVEEHWERYVGVIRQAHSTNVTPIALPAPRTFRRPVKLRDVEPEPETPRRAAQPSPAVSEPKKRGLLGRLFGREQPGKTTITVEAYELESDGWSEVVGESHYQEALEATRALLRRDDELGRDVFDAILVLEPENAYDSEAVAIYSQRGKIGHAPRGSGWFDVLDLLQHEGHNAATCRGSLIGGSNGKSLGAILHADPEEELDLIS